LGVESWASIVTDNKPVSKTMKNVLMVVFTFGFVKASRIPPKTAFQVSTEPDSCGFNRGDV
jgi:hypothetical protein